MGTATAVTKKDVHVELDRIEQAKAVIAAGAARRQELAAADDQREAELEEQTRVVYKRCAAAGKDPAKDPEAAAIRAEVDLIGSLRRKGRPDGHGGASGGTPATGRRQQRVLQREGEESALRDLASRRLAVISEHRDVLLAQAGERRDDAAAALLLLRDAVAGLVAAREQVKVASRLAGEGADEDVLEQLRVYPWHVVSRTANDAKDPWRSLTNALAMFSQ